MGLKLVSKALVLNLRFSNLNTKGDLGGKINIFGGDINGHGEKEILYRVTIKEIDTFNVVLKRNY